MFFCCECCVLSGIGLCYGLIAHPEMPYRLWCVVMCDIEISLMRRPWPTGGCCAKNKQMHDTCLSCRLKCCQSPLSGYPCFVRISGRYSTCCRLLTETSAILTSCFRCLPQSLQANTGVICVLGFDVFLSNSFTICCLLIILPGKP
jgi:hypothetical protein